MGPHYGQCRGIIALYPAYPPGNKSEFLVPGRKEAKLGWSGDSAVDGTSAWEVSQTRVRIPRVSLGGAHGQDAVHPLVITCPSQLPTEVLHDQVLKKHIVWVGPQGGNPSDLGNCPRLRDLECCSGQLLIISVTLDKRPGCRDETLN